MTWEAPTPPVHPALQQPWLYFGAGMALAVGLHIITGLSLFGAAYVTSTPTVQGWIGEEVGSILFGLWTLWGMALSVAQLFYLGPAGIITYRWRPPMAQGILVVAVLTFLLQGSCYALFFAALMTAH